MTPNQSEQPQIRMAIFEDDHKDVIEEETNSVVLKWLERLINTRNINDISLYENIDERINEDKPNLDDKDRQTSPQRATAKN